MSELKPCPFCGCEEVGFGTITYHKDTDVVKLNGQSVFYYANCPNCGSNNRGVIGNKTKEQAAELWNRRATDKPHDIEYIGELKKQSEYIERLKKQLKREVKEKILNLSLCQNKDKEIERLKAENNDLRNKLLLTKRIFEQQKEIAKKALAKEGK